MYKINTLVDRCYFITKGSDEEWKVSYSDQDGNDEDNPMRIKRFEREREAWMYLENELSKRANYFHQFKDSSHAFILWHFADLLQKEHQISNPLPYENKKQIKLFLNEHFQYYRTLSWLEWANPFPRYQLHMIRQHLKNQRKFYTIQSPSLTKDERNNRLFTERETLGFLWQNQIWLARTVRVFPSKEFRDFLQELVLRYKGIEKRKEGSI